MFKKNKPEQILRKEFSFEIKSINEKGEFSGYASVFGNVDAYGDRVLKGAFSRTLAEHSSKGSMPIMLYGHSSARECGEWEEMKEDDRGLFVKGRLWIDGQADQDALKAYRGMTKKRGKMGLSIGYSVPKGGSRFDEKSGTNDLLDLDLWEVSTVVFPANDLARVENVRSRITTIRDFELFLRESGFSKSEAVTVSSKGFKALIPGEQGEELKESLEKLLQTFQN